MRWVFPVKDFNLEHTLECGQAFRWRKIGRAHYGVIGRAFLKVEPAGGRLIVETDCSLDKKAVASYFGLSDNLPDILKEIDVDENIHNAISLYRGLRILKQEPWEATASFILSSYSNIPRIKKTIEGLSENLGAKIRIGCFEAYSFPSADKIASADGRILRRLGLGFRAEYLKEAARKVSSGRFDLIGLGALSYDVAKDKLRTLKGVGDKVADCILLFAFKKFEAFPVDVWIKRGMEKLYFKGRVIGQKEIAGFARGHFGRYAGYAQEYLYHYFRH